MRRRELVIVLLALAACGRRASPAERRRVICLQKAIEQGEAPPTTITLAQLRDACGPAFGPNFEPPELGTSHPANPIDRWKHFASHGDLLCKPDLTGRIRPLEWQALLAACGRDYFGIPSGLEPMFSESWYVGQRIGAWLAGESAKSDDRAGWDAFYQRAAQGSYALEYPLSVPGLYTLPGSATASFDIGGRSLQVVVLADRLLVGSPPRLRLVPGGVSPRVEGFPGSPVATEALSRALVRAPSPTLIAPRELPASRLFEVVAAAPRTDFRILVAAQGRRAVLHRVPLIQLDVASRAELAGGTVDQLVRALDVIERSRGAAPPTGRTRIPVAPARPAH